MEHDPRYYPTPSRILKMDDNMSLWIPFHPNDNPREFLTPPANLHKSGCGQFISEEVLVSDGEKVYIGYYIYRFDDGIGSGVWYMQDLLDYATYRLDGVTKWMSLPQP